MNHNKTLACLRNTIIVFLLFIGMFITSVKMLPSFAIYASSIPIVKIAVNWLQGDSGTEYAKNSGYMEIDGITIEENGIRLELKHIMFDEDRLTVSATVAGEKIQRILDEIKETNEKNEKERIAKHLPNDIIPLERPFISIIYKDFGDTGGFSQSSYESHSVDSYIDIRGEKIFKRDEVLNFLASNPEYLSLDVEVIWYKGKNAKEEIHVFRDIKIPFDKSKFMYSKRYKINEEIIIQGGKLLVEELTISPTRMRLDVSFDITEGYRFVGLEKPYILGPEGKMYIGEGLISATGKSNVLSYYFVPSKYFDAPFNELYFGFEEYLLGEDKEADFILNLHEELPKSFTYMGEEIIITEASYNQDARDKLWIKLLIPPNLKNNGGLSIEGNFSSTSMGFSESDENTPMSFGLEVDYQEEYKVKMQYTGYRYPFNKTIRIDTSK